MSGGMMFASMTAWIWSLFPAVMLEMVQQASCEEARRSGRGNCE